MPHAPRIRSRRPNARTGPRSRGRVSARHRVGLLHSPVGAVVTGQGFWRVSGRTPTGSEPAQAAGVPRKIQRFPRPPSAAKYRRPSEHRRTRGPRAPGGGTLLIACTPLPFRPTLLAPPPRAVGLAALAATAPPLVSAPTACASPPVWRGRRTHACAPVADSHCASTPRRSALTTAAPESTARSRSSPGSSARWWRNSSPSR